MGQAGQAGGTPLQQAAMNQPASSPLASVGGCVRAAWEGPDHGTQGTPCHITSRHIARPHMCRASCRAELCLASDPLAVYPGHPLLSQAAVETVDRLLMVSHDLRRIMGPAPSRSQGWRGRVGFVPAAWAQQWLQLCAVSSSSPQRSPGRCMWLDQQSTQTEPSAR